MKGERTEKAAKLFTEGRNCAQAVLGGFCEPLGLAPSDAARLATGLGGGMGRMGGTCGAVTGAILTLGLAHGGADPLDRDARGKCYAQVQEFAKRFTARNGSTACRDLLGCDISTAEGFEEAKRRGVLDTVCRKAVRDAAEILEEMGV